MSTRIIINDYRENKIFYINLEKIDFEIIEHYWDESDRLLQDLQGEPFFNGAPTWGHLSPTQYRLLIIKSLCSLMTISDADKEDDNNNNNVVMSLRFLCSALVYCLEIRSETIVELMKINRYDDFRVSFDYVSNINLPVKKRQEPEIQEQKFKVIIDNDGDGE